LSRKKANDPRAHGDGCIPCYGPPQAVFTFCACGEIPNCRARLPPRSARTCAFPMCRKEPVLPPPLTLIGALLWALNPKSYNRSPSPHLKPYWAGSLPAWNCFEKQTGPKAPSVIHSARTQHPIPFPWAGSLPAWSCFEKQTGTKAPSVSHPARTKHPIPYPWAGSLRGKVRVQD
jgi:hypothetical protein